MKSTPDSQLATRLPSPEPPHATRVSLPGALAERGLRLLCVRVPIDASITPPRPPLEVLTEDREARFGARAPGFVLSPTREGGHWLGFNHANSVNVCVASLSADGLVQQQHPVRPQGMVSDSVKSRLAGLCASRNGFIAALVAGAGNQAFQSHQRSRLEIVWHDRKGNTLSSIPDALLEPQTDRAVSRISAAEPVPLRSSAMHASTGRLASGGHRACVHLGHLLCWPDGNLVQGGFARCLSTPSGGRPSVRGSQAVDPQDADVIVPWLASHSLDQRCVFDPFRDSFVLASLADGFPRGILLARVGAGALMQQLVHSFPGEPGDPQVGGELGGVVTLRQSIAVSFTSSVVAEPESRDVLVAFASNGLRGTPLLVRVSRHPPGTYAVQPKLALLGRQLLVAWKRVRAETGQIDSMVALVSLQAEVVMRPVIAQGIAFDGYDDFVTDAQGHVCWIAHAQGAPHFMKLEAAARAQPAW